MIVQAALDFIRLNGYGIYVWPAFAVTALALAWMAWDTLRRLRGHERRLAQLQRDEPR